MRTPLAQWLQPLQVVTLHAPDPCTVLPGMVYVVCATHDAPHCDWIPRESVLRHGDAVFEPHGVSASGINSKHFLKQLRLVVSETYTCCANGLTASLAGQSIVDDVPASEIGAAMCSPPRTFQFLSQVRRVEYFLHWLVMYLLPWFLCMSPILPMS